jgi:DivIVA domain-containing protein
VRQVSLKIRHLTDVSMCKLQQHLSCNCLYNRTSRVERALTTAWFDEQQRLTPEDLRTARFPLSRLGRRGYEEEPVNRFLRSVQAEFVRLVSERASLWDEVQRLRRRILAGEAGEAGEAGGDQEPVLSGEAGAGLRDDHIAQEAQQYSDMILEDAEARAREAAVSALSLPAPPQTDREQQAAQAELAYLRTYSEFYRVHLRAYTEGILRGIEEWERTEAASFQEAAPGAADRRSIGR